MRLYSVSSGSSKRCGKCTHLKSNSKIYNTWVGMISRCKYKTHNGYKNYGGRGITVCEEWKKFSNFYKDMGDIPFIGAEIDRINNNDNYNKSNCRWVTHKFNNRNRRNNRLVEFNSETKCLSEWAELFNLNIATLAYRLNAGWCIERALKTKPIVKERCGK